MLCSTFPLQESNEPWSSSAQERMYANTRLRVSRSRQAHMCEPATFNLSRLSSMEERTVWRCPAAPGLRKPAAGPCPSRTGTPKHSDSKSALRLIRLIEKLAVKLSEVHGRTDAPADAKRCSSCRCRSLVKPAQAPASTRQRQITITPNYNLCL